MIYWINKRTGECCLYRGRVSWFWIYAAFNPDNDFESITTDSNGNVRFFKKIELDSLDFLSSETCQLDPDQRRVADLGLSNAQNIKKTSRIIFRILLIFLIPESQKLETPYKIQFEMPSNGHKSSQYPGTTP